MDHIICASLSHTHYSYEVGMLKVPAYDSMIVLWYTQYTTIKQHVYMYVCMYVCMVITYSRLWINRGKVANPARGQLNTENEYSPVPVRA